MGGLCALPPSPSLGRPPDRENLSRRPCLHPCIALPGSWDYASTTPRQILACIKVIEVIKSYTGEYPSPLWLDRYATTSPEWIPLFSACSGGRRHTLASVPDRRTLQVLERKLTGGICRRLGGNIQRLPTADDAHELLVGTKRSQVPRCPPGSRLDCCCRGLSMSILGADANIIDIDYVNMEGSHVRKRQERWPPAARAHRPGVGTSDCLPIKDSAILEMEKTLRPFK